MNIRRPLTSLVCLALIFFSADPRGARAQDSSKDFRVVLLGTGIPIPNPERAAAATLIVAGDTTILIDTGRAFLSRLTSAGFQDVSMVLFTHFHADHISEFGDLMLNRSLNDGAAEALLVLGPKGTERVVSELLAPYREDTAYRIAHHGEHWPKDGMTAAVQEHEPGVIYEQGDLKITMFNVDHDPVVPAVGYRIDFNGRSVVVSGDTMKVPQMVEMARDCDILIHEAMNATFLRGARVALARQSPRRAAMLDDLMSHHTSTIEVAEIARDAGVKKLVLTHLVPSIPPNDAAEKNFVRGVAEIFSGPIVVGRDGMEIRP